MALTATVFKAELQIADMDRGYYADHSLTLARHPSETDERMMVRLLAFALHAGEGLQFTKGLCADDEPELWQRSLTDDILLWIDVGLPDERRLRKACNRARQVVLYAYGGRTAEQWWQRSAPELRRHDNLQVCNLPPEATAALAGLVSRTMRLQCTIQEGQVWLGNGTDTVLVEPQVWQGA
ncbi:YaeQ family protein [Sulfurivermis fontis]|uniref:YaeQ family protein n=1 Tax=Sulfurivermis fontis TaxID=1972068 RepID=UPI000FD8B2CF|nr:YaeQ family protein [Sulfurivermis fontis]